MLIDGYDEDALVPGEPLLDLPGFWAAYLMWLCENDDNTEQPDPSWFGASDAELDIAYAALVDEERWPTFRMPFSDGHTGVVIARNFPEDSGTEYLITHPAWGRPGFLATIDGHQAGPGLSWRELTHIADHPDPALPGIHDPHARLLLLLPALGDIDLPESAVERVSRALTVRGATAGKTPTLATRLLDNPMWEPANWIFPEPPNTTGQRFTGILECDGRMSPRFHMRLAQGIAPELSDRLARALGTWSV